MSPEFVDPQALAELIADQQEFALLDVRPIRSFSERHLWLATNVPLAVFELRVRRLVPRLTTRIVLCDDDGELAPRAAELLFTLGYGNVSVLQGGIRRAHAAGLPMIDGNYVIAHCFGYAIEAAYQTPVITAAELRRKLAHDEAMVVMDARDEADYAAGSIPGSLNIPAAEVIYRAAGLVNDESTPIVVHCAGITRAALGAQGLLNCGMPNPVFVLEDGIRGWVLAGGELSERQPYRLSAFAADESGFCSQAAVRLTQKFDLTHATLRSQREWQQQHPDRTVYYIDIRSQEEYLSGHLQGAILIPGGELAGMTVDHLATWHARLCLLGERDCGRAELTASWMQQLGWTDVVIIKDWRESGEVVTGDDVAQSPLLASPPVDMIRPEELANLMAADNPDNSPLLLDFSKSAQYRQAHIPGAVWASRFQLANLSLLTNNEGPIVCTSSDGQVARLAAAELVGGLSRPVQALTGGNQAWVGAGLSLTSIDPNFLHGIDDVDATVSGPDGDGRSKQEAWHRKCIRWRHSLPAAFAASRPWAFTLPD